jgi:hypothetical protein
MLPTNPPIELPRNHTPMREVCSLRLYHIAVTMLKPGDIADSVAPRKNLTARRPAAF